MKLNKYEILGKALKEYLKKTAPEKIEDMIDIYTFTGIVYATLDALELEPIRDSSNNIKGYEVKKLYIIEDKTIDKEFEIYKEKLIDGLAEHIIKNIHRSLIEE